MQFEKDTANMVLDLLSDVVKEEKPVLVDQVFKALGFTDSQMAPDIISPDQAKDCNELKAEIEKAETYEELIAIADRCVSGSEAEFLALKKAILLANDFEECLEVLSANIADNDEIIDEVLEKALGFADSVIQCECIIERAGFESAIFKLAVQKAFDLSVNVEDFVTVFVHTSPYSELGARCIQKIAELLQKQPTTAA